MVNPLTAVTLVSVHSVLVVGEGGELQNIFLLYVCVLVLRLGRGIVD